MNKLILAAFVIILSAWGAGCGKAGSFTAPSGSTVSVNPSAITLAGIAADTTKNLTVTVKDENGNPLNGVQVSISGGFAAPRATARYQFYTALNGGGTAVNSGFTGTTDSFGTYSFSIIIPATVGGAANAFTDTIDITTGTAYVGVSVTLS